MIYLLLLLGTLTNFGLSGRIFTSKHVTLAGSPYFMNGNPPASSSYSMPAEVTSPCVLSMSLSGYSFSHTNIISFKTWWQMNGALIQIWIRVDTPMQVSLLQYNLIFINTTQDALKLYNGTLYPTQVNLAGGAIEQFIDLNLGTVVDPSSVAYAYLINYQADVTDSNNFIMCNIEANSTIAPFTVRVRLSKAYLNRRIIRVDYTMLLINKTALLYTNIPRYHSMFGISASNLLTNLPSRFDIPLLFNWTSPVNFDINCAISISFLFLLKNPTSRQIYFDITNIDAGRVSSIGGSDVLYSDYLVDCFLEFPCPNGTYFDEVTSACTPCVFPCSTCLSPTFCLSCSSSQYYWDLNSTCLPCSTLNSYCSYCSVNQAIGLYQCTECVPPGYLSNNSCYPCSSVFPYCLDCSSSTQCTQCSQGNLFAGICSTAVGCIFPIILGSQVKCNYCDITANFQIAATADGLCQCKDKYTLIDGICKDVCGDGYMISTAQYACDDGNLVDGDGCSSTCEVEVGYRCENGSATSPSSCVYVSVPLAVTLSSILHNEGLNQGLFVFKVYPPLLAINKMDMEQCVSLNCSSEYSVSSIKYSSGYLKLTVDYSQDLEGQNCELVFKPNWDLLRAQESSLSFQAVSNNTPLIISKQIESYQTIKFFFQILAYISVATLLLTLAHKLIGAELMFTCQTACLLHALSSPPSFLYEAAKSLGTVTGFMGFLFDPNTEFLPPFSQRYSTSPLFLTAEAAVIALLAAAVGLWVVLTLGQLVVGRGSDFEYTQERPDEYPRVSAFARGLYRFLIFPVTASFLLPLLLGIHVGCWRQAAPEGFPTLQLNALGLLLCSFVIAGCAVCETGRSRFLAHYQGEEGVARCYPTFFMLRVCLFAVAVEVGLPDPGSGGVPVFLLVFECLCTVFVVWWRPYASALNQVGLLLCQCTVLYVLGLALLPRFLSVAELTEVFLLFIMQGLLILCMLFSLVRLGYHYYLLHLLDSSNNNNPDVNILSDKGKATKPPTSLPRKSIAEVSEFLKMNKSHFQQHPLKGQSVLSYQEKKIIREEEEQQLKRMKRKLREDLLHHKKRLKNQPLE